MPQLLDLFPVQVETQNVLHAAAIDHRGQAETRITDGSSRE